MTSRRSAVVAIVIAIAVVAGCSSDESDGFQSAPTASPSGPLSVQWGAPETSQMCFPGTADDGTVTIGGHMVTNSRGIPIKLLDYRLGVGSVNMDIIAKLVIPVLPEKGGYVSLFGSWPSYPPIELLDAMYRNEFERAVSVDGFELQNEDRAEIVVGLAQVDESLPSFLSYIDVVYEYDGSRYHAYTPTAVTITGNANECPR